MARRLESLSGIARYLLGHPGFIYRYGGGNEFRFWLPGMVSPAIPTSPSSSAALPRTAEAGGSPCWSPRSSPRGSIHRDYVTKREEYLAYGLLEYWIVDPQQKTRDRLHPRRRLLGRASLRDDQLAPSLVLPGLDHRVADLWSDGRGGRGFRHRGPNPLMPRTPTAESRRRARVIALNSTPACRRCHLAGYLDERESVPIARDPEPGARSPASCWSARRPACEPRSRTGRSRGSPATSSGPGSRTRVSRDEFYAGSTSPRSRRRAPRPAPRPGDRCPLAGEQALCRPWLDELIGLIRARDRPARRLAGDPDVPSGRQVALGRCRDRHDPRSASAISPLPHPSGVSRWLNEPANVAAVDRAMTILRGWIEETEGRPAETRRPPARLISTVPALMRVRSALRPASRWHSATVASGDRPAQHGASARSAESSSRRRMAVGDRLLGRAGRSTSRPRRRSRAGRSSRPGRPGFPAPSPRRPGCRSSRRARGTPGRSPRHRRRGAPALTIARHPDQRPSARRRGRLAERPGLLLGSRSRRAPGPARLRHLGQPGSAFTSRTRFFLGWKLATDSKYGTPGGSPRSSRTRSRSCAGAGSKNSSSAALGT